MENSSQVYLTVSKKQYNQDSENYLKRSSKYKGIDVSKVLAKLKNGGIRQSLKTGAFQKEFGQKASKGLIQDMAAYRLVEYKNRVSDPMLTLKPCSQSFQIDKKQKAIAKYWQVSRFSYLHWEEGEFILRNPKALCYLVIHDAAVIQLFYAFKNPESLNEIQEKYAQIPKNVFDLLIEAKIIAPCSDQKINEESEDDTLRQWGFHDLIFHSLSRTGRTEKDIGGSFRFKGILDPQPALKENVWKENSISLPKPNLAWLYQHDKPFTQVLESRTSIRNYGVLPLSIEELGEFLFRSARVRYEFSSDYGDFISKPYPGGGANYETEFYITINACAGVPRGMYYYDPKEHMLSLVSKPNEEMEMLLHDAYTATAMQGYPQILITLANRFNRFNWKYSSMSYAAQLKNIGVIYQTLYLVATSMGIGACGLGVGNTERFSKLTALDYFEEGSVGEFMIGRPLLK